MTIRFFKEEIRKAVSLSPEGLIVVGSPSVWRPFSLPKEKTMKIPTNLRNVHRNKLIRIVNALRKAIAAECRRCLGKAALRGVQGCGGLNLEQGNCPLYPFRPWTSSNAKK